MKVAVDAVAFVKSFPAPPSAHVPSQRQVDSARVIRFVVRMTATQVIRQIKQLPDREQAKVRRYIYRNHVPNATTRKALRETKGLVRCKDVEDLFAQLKI